VRILLIICTGISGSGKKEYVKSVKEIAKSAGKELVEVHTGDKMYKKSEELGYPIANGAILDTSERQLDYLRGLVFEEIIRMKDITENILVVTHACFRWHKHLTKAFDYYYLSKLNPDLYITVTDTIYSIFGRLEQNQWRGRNNLTELLTWRDEEEFETKTFARIQKKPHFLVARSEPPETLYNLIFEPKMKKGYLSYPISGAEREAIQKVERIRDELRKNLIIFDPMAIKDVDWLSLALAQKKKGKTSISIPFLDYDGSKKEITIPIEEFEKASIFLKDQTIARDYGLIDQSDFVAVNYYDPDLPSPGVQREIRYAKDSGKPVYLYYPRDVMSPFQELDITKHFQDLNEFVGFLKKM
jgi:adenylate kinase